MIASERDTGRLVGYTPLLPNESSFFPSDLTKGMVEIPETRSFS